MSQIRWEFIQSSLGLRRGSRVLDVGYGNGAFLKHVKSQGMEIFGADIHHEDFGVPEVNLWTKLHFDLICFFDSLEHFISFEGILELQADYVVVSIPNLPRSFLARPQDWRHYKPGEHLHYFSTPSLDRLMLRWGFARKVQEGHPEDSIRGRISIAGDLVANIYTAIYSKC